MLLKLPPKKVHAITINTTQSLASFKILPNTPCYSSPLQAIAVFTLSITKRQNIKAYGLDFTGKIRVAGIARSCQLLRALQVQRCHPPLSTPVQFSGKTQPAVKLFFEEFRSSHNSFIFNKFYAITQILFRAYIRGRT